jgi:hypothetical protein
LIAHGLWFSPGTQASSTTKTGRHDIAEILLKVALNTVNHNVYFSRIYQFVDLQLIVVIYQVPVAMLFGKMSMLGMFFKLCLLKESII